VTFKKVIVHILLIASLTSGLAIFVSSQLSEVEITSYGTQKILSFLDTLFREKTSKKSKESKRKSSSPDQASNVKSSGFNQGLIYEMASKDFKNLKTISDRRLFNVQSINWQIRDNEISKQSLQKSLSINIDKESSVALEIEVFSQTDQSEKLTIIQFSYTDVSNGNKIHEFSRMYQQGKKKPD
jgi:hypothetical protein